MARAAASPPLPRPAPSPTPARASLLIGAHPQASSAGHLPSPSHPAAPPPPPSPARLCFRRGCTSPVPPLCSTSYCDSHCHSRRCSHHRLSVPQPIPPVIPSRPACPPRTCCSSGCSVGLCSTHLYMMWPSLCQCRFLHVRAHCLVC